MRIKIATIANRVENTEETKETDSRLEAERSQLIDAAIVRTMKNRKQLSHGELINEVTSQLSRRFTPKVVMMKLAVERLIDREYLERDNDDRKLLRYMVSRTDCTARILFATNSTKLHRLSNTYAASCAVALVGAHKRSASIGCWSCRQGKVQPRRSPEQCDDVLWELRNSKSYMSLVSQQNLRSSWDTISPHYSRTFHGRPPFFFVTVVKPSSSTSGSSLCLGRGCADVVCCEVL